MKKYRYIGETNIALENGDIVEAYPPKVIEVKDKDGKVMKCNTLYVKGRTGDELPFSFSNFEEI